MEDSRTGAIDIPPDVDEVEVGFAAVGKEDAVTTRGGKLLGLNIDPMLMEDTPAETEETLEGGVAAVGVVVEVVVAVVVAVLGCAFELFPLSFAAATGGGVGRDSISEGNSGWMD